MTLKGMSLFQTPPQRVCLLSADWPFLTPAAPTLLLAFISATDTGSDTAMHQMVCKDNEACLHPRPLPAVAPAGICLPPTLPVLDPSNSYLGSGYTSKPCLNSYLALFNKR